MADWSKWRQSSNVDDRRDDPWPWHKIAGEPDQQFRSTPTVDEILGLLQNKLAKDNIPPITSQLQLDAGTRDVGPISSEELMRFLLQVEGTNLDPQITRRK